MERRKDSERRQEKRGEKRGRVGDMKNKRNPRNELFGTAVPTLCCCGDIDFAQPSIPSSSIRQNRDTLRLGAPTHKALVRGLNPSHPPSPALPPVPQALTREGGAAHQVGVGEVERGVQHEVGFDDSASLLADVVEEPGALQWDTALVAILGKEKG